MYFLLKVLISALVIAAVSEVAKRNIPGAAVLASLPLTSILALLWLYRDTGNAQAVLALTSQIFWALLPSLLFFVVLPGLLRAGLRFPLALPLSVAAMLAGYACYLGVLKKLGLHL